MSDSTDVRTELATESLAAYRHCREAAFYLTQHGSDAATPELMTLLFDTAELHRTLADLLTRHSPFSIYLARLCKAAADDCADALEPHSREDGALRVAYGACRQTARCGAAFFGEDQDEAPDPLHEGLLETFPASDPLPPPTEL